MMAAFMRPIYINKRAFAKQDHGEAINGTKYSRMDKVKLVEGSLLEKLNHITSNFLRAVFHSLYLVQS